MDSRDALEAAWRIHPIDEVLDLCGYAAALRRLFHPLGTFLARAFGPPSCRGFDPTLRRHQRSAAPHGQLQHDCCIAVSNRSAVNDENLAIGRPESTASDLLLLARCRVFCGERVWGGGVGDL